VTDVRKIDRWFPIDAVDEAVGTPAGSGRSEKALMTWFASRPIAQARAAILTALLPDANGDTQRLIEVAVRGRDKRADDGTIKPEAAVTFDVAVEKLSAMVAEKYPNGPVVLDPFSGRGIIPLEAARFGARAIGTDLSPLATLAGRLLADYPYRDWSNEPELPDGWYETPAKDLLSELHEGSRLVRDVEAFLAEVGRRLASKAETIYPRNPDGEFPWGYLWAVTISCDGCNRRFPLVGSLVLRYPHAKADDPGQWMRLETEDDDFRASVENGVPDQQPTFAVVGDKRAKSARCIFCGHVHSRDVLKMKGFAGDYIDRALVAADNNSGDGPSKLFRPLREEEVDAVLRAIPEPDAIRDGLSLVPDEVIPDGNKDTVRATGYGYKTYGSLMGGRQALQFTLVIEAIGEAAEEAARGGLSPAYLAALQGYACATLVRRTRRSTRGAKLKPFPGSKSRSTWVQVDDIYSSESKVSDNFDFFETGPGKGPATWGSIASGTVLALKKVMAWPSGLATAGRFRPGSATSLPLRDGSVDAVVTDPPYYNMIDYSDASDLLYVWARRTLYDAMPDLFGADAPTLQPKDDEIIVKRGGGKQDHRTIERYHDQLAASFTEMRRVLKDDGHLTVVFGHHDPDAWLRLLGALRKAGFVVTSSWPSRTESANTGVASIKVTVAIGCRVAPSKRPDGMMSQVDLEVRQEVAARVKRWRDDGLALPDQMMASYGPAMEVHGRYAAVYKPNGEEAELDRYLLLARSVVKDATSLVIDSLPLETFDAPTRLAIYWLQFYGLGIVPKGESRFIAQTESIRIEDVRELFAETKAGFALDVSLQDADVTGRTPVFALVRAMAARWTSQGAEGVAHALSEGEAEGCISGPSDPHLWAVVTELGRVLPRSHKTATALASVERSRSQVVNLTGRVTMQTAGEHRQQTFDVGDNA
jgi:putative DNA methylase